ncbi:MAG: iron-sulfur cluster assembly scaffold protein [Acidobacteria bacterium]|nr:iron-sulfur cluster assembly scaffold protein [Acidobacteriota bacterium]
MGVAYSEAVRQRCRDPRRAGGWPDEAAGIGTGATGSLDDGVWTRLQVHVSSAGDVIDDARFRVFGCSAAVASASFVADALVGVAPGAVRALEARDVADALALPEDKHAMAAMAIAAARAAVDDWEARTGVHGPGRLEAHRHGTVPGQGPRR